MHRRHRRHHRHLRRRHVAHLVLAVAASAGIFPAHAAAQPAVDPLTVGYSHIDELDFHPSPDIRPAGNVYPVLRSVEPCVDGYMPRVLVRYSSTKPVLVCW